MKTSCLLRAALLCGSLIGLSACTMQQLGNAITISAKMQATRFYSDQLPLRMNLNLSEKITQNSKVFSVNEEGDFYAHLVFHLPDWEKSAENKRLYNELGNLMLKFNNHQDFPNFNAKLLPNEEIRAKLSVQNAETGQIVSSYQIDLKGTLSERYMAFHSDSLHETAIAISPTFPIPNSALRDHFRFHLPKGKYRLIFENQNNSTAYQAHQPRLQFAPQLVNW